MRVVAILVGGCLLALASNSPLPAAAPPAAGGKAARDVLARLEKGAGAKERMRALVALVKAGPDAVGPLVETLQKGSAENRTFAAWVLGILADPAARPALEKALDDPEQPVRSQAVVALRMLGPLKLTDRQRQALEGSNYYVRTHLELELARKDDPNPAAIRKALQEYDSTRIDVARVGQLAPDFSLADLSGKTQSLSQIREGKGVGGPRAVVLVFLRIDH
jgi:HEAT repeat protein